MGAGRSSECDKRSEAASSIFPGPFVATAYARGEGENASRRNGARAGRKRFPFSGLQRNVSGKCAHMAAAAARASSAAEKSAQESGRAAASIANVQPD
jgi:hypothetical protein